MTTRRDTLRTIATTGMNSAALLALSGSRETASAKAP